MAARSAAALLSDATMKKEERSYGRGRHPSARRLLESRVWPGRYGWWLLEPCLVFKVVAHPLGLPVLFQVLAAVRLALALRRMAWLPVLHLVVAPVLQLPQPPFLARRPCDGRREPPPELARR